MIFDFMRRFLENSHNEGSQDMEKVSLETLSAMQLTANMEGRDAQSELIMQSREVLAVILQETVSEYKGYSRREIMDLIEPKSIRDRKEVSAGRTNTQIQGGSAEFNQLNEKVSFSICHRRK